MYTGKTNAVVNVVCPYFLAEGEKSLVCEGVCPAAKNKITFGTEAEKDAYIIRHCIRYPNNCFIACASDERYK